MISGKLTLSAEPDIIAEAKRLARSRRTSVSALFSRFVAGLGQLDRCDESKPGPLTRRASGLVRLAPGISDQVLLEEALAERHRL